MCTCLPSIWGQPPCYHRPWASPSAAAHPSDLSNVVTLPSCPLSMFYLLPHVPSVNPRPFPLFSCKLYKSDFGWQLISTKANWVGEYCQLSGSIWWQVGLICLGAFRCDCPFVGTLMVGGLPGAIGGLPGSVGGRERCVTRPPTTHQALPLAGHVMGGGAHIVDPSFTKLCPCK